MPHHHAESHPPAFAAPSSTRSPPQPGVTSLRPSQFLEVARLFPALGITPALLSTRALLHWCFLAGPFTQACLLWEVPQPQWLRSPPPAPCLRPSSLSHSMPSLTSRSLPAASLALAVSPTGLQAPRGRGRPRLSHSPL